MKMDLDCLAKLVPEPLVLLQAEYLTDLLGYENIRKACCGHGDA